MVHQCSSIYVSLSVWEVGGHKNTDKDLWVFSTVYSVTVLSRRGGPGAFMSLCGFYSGGSGFLTQNTTCIREGV